MSDVVIKAENIWKEYRLGAVSHQTVGKDLQSWWARVRGKEDPNALIASTVQQPNASTVQHLSDSTVQRFNDPTLAPDRFWALRDVSFEVKQGEVLGIIGRNGAGKSTLLKILSRVTTPTKGQIEVTGRIASLLEVGTGFHPELTGRENVFLNGAILGMSKEEIRRKFDEIVDFAEIEKFIDTPVKRYSSGMYVRLAFGVAAHLEPEILIVDEVLAVGDAQFQKKCLGKMQEVGREGRTVLFVSHNLAAVTGLCSKGLLLSSGLIESTGDISNVVARYLDNIDDSGYERTWNDTNTAPGDEVLRLKAVRIISEGSVTGNVSIDKELSIEIEYWNLQEGSLVSASIHLLGKGGVEVLASANIKSACLGEDEWAGKPQSIGIYCSRCVLPANFLNESNYSINVILLTDITKLHVKVDDVVTFKAHDTGEMRKEYTGGWLGVVRPKLAWQTELLERV